MAARPAQASPSMEQFEAYFQRADLDRDGRISGAEAVAFFQGSNLPKNVLAQIWSYSDQKNTSFLGRAEFYNALRLVTVAQSGKQLTPEIVKAALEGPTAAKIPAPRINPVAPVTSVNAMSAPRPQFNNVMPSSTQMGGMPQNTFPNLGVRGSQSQVVPGTGMNQQYMPPSSNQFMRPLQGAFASPSVQMQPVNQGLPGGGSVAGPSLSGSAIPNLSTDWFSARTGGPSAFGTSQFASKGITASAHQDGFGSSHSLTTNSSMIRPQAMPAPLTPNSTGPLLSSAQPGAQDSKAPVVSGNGFSSAFGGMPATMVGGSGLQRTQSLAAQNQLDIIPSIAVQPSATGLGVSTSNSTQSEVPWPKMTQSSIQKYTKVFMEVDKDRDGKITGEEARNLFLSWRLPREVLKQVWDLSDQDSDSMLSLSEFCIALYLMERYREGRSLPPMLPNSVKFDDTLVQVTRQSSAGYGGLAWQPGSGMPGARPLMSATALRPQQLAQMPLQIDGQMQQQKSTMQVMDKQFGSFGNQFNNEEQNALNSNAIEAAETGGKVKELEKEIMDSKEKLEFYRSKMQDLVLYKSRCDNRLNEIMENASASKREVEELAKRYEEKYKQVGEIASKLTVEEATFRDIQERKLELYNAIVKMEQGGSADGLLQVRADRIQSDLEELAKALNDRCKKRGLDVKSSVIIELPFGWQPGIQEGAVDWDEDWDKFEDEGFILSKELTVDTDNGVASRKSKTSSGTSNEIFDEDTSHSGLSDVNKLEKLSSPGERATESEFVFAQSEDGSARSPSSPLGKNALDSPSREFHPPQFDNHDASPHANDSHSDHGGAESSFFSDGKYGDESSWGATFDANDDTDSIWGFNTSNKEVGHDMHKQNSFFDSGDFGLNPIRTGSPSASSVFGKEKSPFFADSVPGTPSFNAGPSPRYNEERPTFDSFRHFDSFNTQGNLARFDSMRSTTTDFSQGGLFNQRENLARFDSIRSSGDFDRSHGFQSFDDADPFGTGPFKPSESNTPRRASDNWSAF